MASKNSSIEKNRIVDKESRKIFIIMEYCEGGDMAKLIRKCRKENDFVSEDVIWKIFTQLL
jgi:NIMA (never in mitosis gene a)-related kinase 2